jgi:hypothetical protein
MEKEIGFRIAEILDLITDLFIKGVGIAFIFQGCYLSACICFGMSGIWSACSMFARYAYKNKHLFY